MAIIRKTIVNKSILIYPFCVIKNSKKLGKEEKERKP
jgi:hypothetical protein